MRICVDLTPLLLRSAGVKSYLYYWFHALRAAAGEHQIKGFLSVEPSAPLSHDGSMLPALSTWARLGLVHGIGIVGSTALDVALGKADLFHASSMTRTAPTRARLTATIHDVTTVTMPELHTEGNIRADRYYADRILKHADRIIAVSENTRQDAIKAWNLDPNRVVTIHSGVPAEYFTAQPTSRAKSYVLCAGTIEPRKNIARLLDAWKSLRADLQIGRAHV